MIFDCGSFSVKAGTSEDEVPHFVRSLVGRSRRSREKGQQVGSKPSQQQSNAEEMRTYVGDAALGLGNTGTMSEPICESMVENFDDFELLIEYIYSSVLNRDSASHPVVFAEPPFNSDPRREKICEVFFEKFGVPELNITLQGVLALVGTGRVTGLVLDCGHGGCNTVPIFESFVIPNGIESLRIGGRDVDVLLGKFFAALKKVRLTKTGDKETIRDIKEKLCFCRKSSDTTEFSDPIVYELPDGQKIELGNERFAVPEAYFAPSLVGAEGEGVAALVAKSVKKSPIDLTKPLVSNIILAGGSSLFSGFAQRLAAEVKGRVSGNMAREVKVVASDDRAMSIWNGGRAFAELRTSFEERWMTKSEYEEFGADFIHSKVMGSRSN